MANIVAVHKNYFETLDKVAFWQEKNSTALKIVKFLTSIILIPAAILYDLIRAGINLLSKKSVNPIIHKSMLQNLKEKVSYLWINHKMKIIGLSSITIAYVAFKFFPFSNPFKTLHKPPVAYPSTTLVGKARDTLNLPNEYSLDHLSLTFSIKTAPNSFQHVFEDTLCLKKGVKEIKCCGIINIENSPSATLNPLLQDVYEGDQAISIPDKFTNFCYQNSGNNYLTNPQFLQKDRVEQIFDTFSKH